MNYWFVFLLERCEMHFMKHNCKLVPFVYMSPLSPISLFLFRRLGREQCPIAPRPLNYCIIIIYETNSVDIIYRPIEIYHSIHTSIPNIKFSSFHICSSILIFQVSMLKLISLLVVILETILKNIMFLHRWEDFS